MFEHALLGELLGEKVVSAAFSGESMLEHFLQFELALTQSLASNGIIKSNSAHAIIDACKSFEPDLQGIRMETLIDGLAVPVFVRQLKAHIGEPFTSDVHWGATSQDLIDTALALTLKSINSIFINNIRFLQNSLEDLIQIQGGNTLMGRTRMQAALPITAGDRLMTWKSPLDRHRVRLENISPSISMLQLGGAVGTNHVLGDKAAMVAREMAKTLGLQVASRQWHTERDNLVDYANWLSAVTGTLGKIGQDVCLMAQQGIDDIRLQSGGSSSAMPHKQNPIAAETLVTLARFNAVQVSGMHQALVHEQERSGSAWALEWMILPKMCEATACALKTADRLMNQIIEIGHGPAQPVRS